MDVSIKYSVGRLVKGEVVHEYQLIGTGGEFPDEEAAAIWLNVNVPLFFSWKILSHCFSLES